MTDDLIKRLRDWVPAEGPPEGRTAPDAVADMHEAIDRIEALQADNAKMRKTLEQIAYGGAGVPYGFFGEPLLAYQLQRLAIAALQETER